MRKMIIASISLYQKIFSPDTGISGGKNICAFYPTCSEYAKTSIEKYGLLQGGAKSLSRIARCHPWQKNHIDLP